MSTNKQLSLKDNMLWNSAGSMVRLACNYLITIAAVRLSSGFDVAGGLAIAMSIANLVLPFADYRLRTLQITDVKNERSSNHYVGLRILTSFIAFFAGSFYALFTASLNNLVPVILYLIYCLIISFTEVFRAIDWRNYRMDISGISYILQGVIDVVSFSFGLWLTNSLIWAIIAMTVSEILLGILYDAPRAAKFESIKPALEILPSLKLLLTLTPLAVSQVLSTIVFTIPRQQLEISLGADALGIYASVASPVLIVQMGATYVYSPLLRELAQRLNSDKHSALKLIKKTTGFILLITGLLSVLLLIFGNWLLTILFGNEISQHTYILQPAILFTLITAFVWFMNDLLITIRNYKGAFIGNAIAAVLTITLSQGFITMFGINGPSWVGTASYSSALIVMVVVFAHNYRKLPRHSSIEE
ncbi:lipopolysaccharide biosynthesis protein [Arcanobacterium phocae]|uniref:Membrane protein involved in the export of O-antigen and teichoic acid n=1 Tax=Arcanobacterium phocae TaxID=131112 RepID=A0A1H2LBJ6_9ACTO|nr:polysaccharide biosynthesis protein [Arcanobacterium phocae]SDU78212.1 Membrane protein involved in the export of O-antigen and teichoic acid [Arcanobacterium phocae]